MMRSYLGHDLPQSTTELLEPNRTALVVVDVQNDFIHEDGYFGGSAALQRIVEPISALAATARSAGITVHFAQIIQEEDGSASSPVWITEALRRNYRPLQCIRGTWGAENVEELTPHPEDVVHVKRRRSAFRGTNLDRDLSQAGITTVVLTGLAADGCVEYSARDALDLDYHPIIAVDGIANAGDGPAASWREHYERFLPADYIKTSAEIRDIWNQS